MMEVRITRASFHGKLADRRWLVQAFQQDGYTAAYYGTGPTLRDAIKDFRADGGEKGFRDWEYLPTPLPPEIKATIEEVHRLAGKPSPFGRDAPVYQITEDDAKKLTSHIPEGYCSWCGLRPAETSFRWCIRCAGEWDR